MSIPFVHRNLTTEELERWRLLMSTFNDGSGQEKDEMGNTRLGWRDVERVVASVLGGIGGEDKQIFDVLVPDPGNAKLLYGVSIKSKELSRKSAIQDLAQDGRVYMELCNSPAKLWTPIKAAGFSESDFEQKKQAAAIGKSVLDTVEAWHKNYAAIYASANKGCNIDLDKSVYLTLSYSKTRNHQRREYQVHAFPLDFPVGIEWHYASSKCLRAFDPQHPDEVLLDWYGLSGGQLKYYPRASVSKFSSPRFSLNNPRTVTLEEKASRYWPSEWVGAKGEVPLTVNQVAQELASYAALFEGKPEAGILLDASKKLAAKK